LALTVVASFEDGHEKETYMFKKFKEFIDTHDKKYETVEEYFARFEVFKSNYLKTESFALDPTNTPSYTVGVTKFFDLTPAEFRRNYLGLKINVTHFMGKKQKNEELLKALENAPESLNWVEKGAIGAVKDQGQCGSCWAFSTIGALEGRHFIQNNETVILSEQDLVDCDTVDSGCNGGLMGNAYDFIIKNNGVESSKDYPYTARDGKCKDNKKKHSDVQVKSKVVLENTDEDHMIAALQSGPLAIAINADLLQSYTGGVIDAKANKCDPSSLDHGVVLVGYTKDTWIIRNSWANSWGEDGYFRFKRGQNTCGVNNYVAYPLFK